MSARRPTRAPARKRRGLALGAVVLALAGVGVYESGLLEEPLRELALPLRHEDIIRQQAAQKGVPADLIAAVIYQESRFRDQTSSAGARGLMQITPDTAEVVEKLSGGETFVTEDLADPDINIRYGTFYLRHLLERFNGNVIAALAGYNAGPENAEAWGGPELDEGDIRFEETRSYVETVTEKRHEYREAYRDELGL